MLVSVVMPAYNAAPYLRAAVASVQAQTHRDWELIIVDDCSPDDTYTIAEGLAKEDSRIRPFRNPRNSGAAATRNYGVSQSRGAYVAFLDSDDTWRPEKLERQLARLRSAGADLCYTSYALVSENGERCRGDYIVPETVDYPALLKENVIGCSTILLTAELAHRFPFEQEFYHEDYVLWLKMLRAGAVAVGCTQVLTSWCYRENSRSYNKVRGLRERWRIYRKAAGLSVCKSLYYLTHYVWAGLRKYRRCP